MRLDRVDRIAQTLWSRVGADVVVVETTVPDRDIALSFTSTYLSQRGTDTVASHACARAGAPPESWSRRIAGGRLDGASPRDATLLDHLAQLQDALAEQGLHVQLAIDGDELRSTVPQPGG
jgi:hypothetical protein